MQWYGVNVFALSSDFRLINKLHISFSISPHPTLPRPTQYCYKSNDFSRHTVLGSSFKSTHKLWPHATAQQLQKSVFWKKNYFLFVLVSQIDVTFLNGVVRINRPKKDKTRGTITRNVMRTISTEVIKTCPSILLLFKV